MEVSGGRGKLCKDKLHNFNIYFLPYITMLINRSNQLVYTIYIMKTDDDIINVCGRIDIVKYMLV
jgi:hypothetical protein